MGHKKEEKKTVSFLFNRLITPARQTTVRSDRYLLLRIYIGSPINSIASVL